MISAETKGQSRLPSGAAWFLAWSNYDAASVAQALADLKASKASGPSEHGLIIDAAHGNCGKNEVREAEVVEEIAARVAAGEQGILGIMMESFLKAGNQKPAPLDQLEYGKSITDACVPWDRTEQLLHACRRGRRASQAADVSAPSLLSLGKEATRRARSCSSS